VPDRTAFPPKAGPFSMSSTRAPRDAAWPAAVCPANPASEDEDIGDEMFSHDARPSQLICLRASRADTTLAAMRVSRKTL
jgi:hypothetical protein